MANGDALRRGLGPLVERLKAAVALAGSSLLLVIVYAAAAVIKGL